MIFASDLDGTLIYSKRLIPPGLDELICVEIYKEEPLSFLMPKALSLLKKIAEHLLFIPTTTRTRAQYQRIHLFYEEIIPKYAIVDNGGIILEKNRVDYDWDKSIQEGLKCGLAKEDVAKAFREISHSSWVTKSGCGDRDLFYYFLINRELLPVKEVEQFADWLNTRNWQLSIQGRKLYLVPTCIDKRNAVAYLKEKEGIKHVLAAGDSLLDLNLLNYADTSIAPSHGELYNSRHIKQVDSIHFTETSGILAGEEILKTIVNTVLNSKYYIKAFDF